MQKKLLVLNGSHSDIPLIEAGKKLGYYVISTGNRPDLIGHKYADEYHSADFSDKKEIYELAKKLKIDAICSCANDFGAITAAYVAEKIGLPGHDPYEIALKLHHKDKFKKFSKEYNIKTPVAESFENIEVAINKKEEFNYPIIVKPIDLTGGKGITKVYSEFEFEQAVTKAFNMSHQHRIVIESFIEGTQHSFSTFLVNKKVIAYFSDNEYSYLNPYLVSTSAAPAIDVDKVEKILIDEAEKIASLLNLVDGVFHIQYILSKGKPYILEITRRCSGDFYSYPVTYATEIPWAEWIVRAECGLDCSTFPKNKWQSKFCGRHCIMGSKNGVIKNVKIADEIVNNIYEQFLWWKPGDEITNYMVDKLGVLFLKYDSNEEMINKTNRINELIVVEYE